MRRLQQKKQLQMRRLQQKKPERFGSIDSMYKVTFGFVTIYL